MARAEQRPPLCKYSRSSITNDASTQGIKRSISSTISLASIPFSAISAVIGLFVNDAFAKEGNLSLGQQDLIFKYINSFESETLDEAQFEELKEKANEFIDSIKILDEDTIKEINELTDPSKFDSYQQYINAVLEYVNSGKLKAAKIEEKDFMALLGFESWDKDNKELNNEVTKKAEEITTALKLAFGEEYSKKWGEFKVQIVADDLFFWYNKLDILSAKLAPCFFQKSRKNTGRFAVLRLYFHFIRK